jgi:chemosensory pili system protein ChpA (sensor histidine kinase/response regulator)
MATSSLAPTGSFSQTGINDIGANDLGPLAWVLDELRKSLDSATKAIRRYVRDAELAKGSDLNAADASQLRIARQQLHQSVGALEMVGFASPAALLRGMEGAVQKFVAKPDLCTDAAAVKVERASFALLGYLEALLVGKKPSAVELFSQYADVQELAGASRVHPADLWSVPWQWRDVQDTGMPVMALDAGFRARFDKSALMVVKSANIQACGELAQLSAGLANQTETAVDANFRVFWRIAAGMLEAVASQSLAPDLHVKRTVSRLLIQLSMHFKGDLSVPDRLAQDLLFFCAQATPQGTTPLLGEVRMVYGLAQHIPVDYSKSFYGQFDPTLLVQARKRIGQLKESWSAFTAGELSRAKPVQDQISLLVDSIGKLLPQSGQNLITAFNEVTDSTARIQKPPEASLGMEVATAILYLEASFEDFDPEDEQLASRMAHLAQRVQMSRGGAPSQPLESWMEELYRRVSDRQTMGSVVGELKLTLNELEKMLDAYFRDPQDKVLLSDVPSRLTQMRGVLTVLGLDHATQAVTQMRGSIEYILLADIDKERDNLASVFNKLGNNLGALGFLIDMLSYQPVLAKKMFVFNADEAELKPLMGRTLTQEPQPSQRLPAASPSAFNADATMPMPAVIAPAASATDLSAALTSAAAPSAPAVGLSTVAVIVDTQEVDPELLEIFLEEAREVAENGLAATQALVAEPNNIGEMTTLRRAFHTLKGSSRMVGLNVFGEAAWSMEQVMNAWLADQKPASAELCQLSTQALQAHQVWIEEIAAGSGKHRTAAPFRASADALRLHGQLQPIAFETASVPVDTVEAIPVDTAPALEPLSVAEPAIIESTSALAGFELPEMALPTALAATAAVAAQEAPAVLSDFSLPELDLPDLQLSEPAAAQDISSHLADLDTSLAVSNMPAMLAPEPFVTIATPVAAPAVISEQPVIADQSAPSAAPMSIPEPEIRFEDIDFDLDITTSEPVAELGDTPAVQSTSVTADSGSDIDWSSALPEPQPILSASEQDALITSDELAAFERAMMAMDDSAMAAPEIAETPSSQEPEIAQQAEFEPDFEISAIDLQALQNLPAPGPAAASAVPFDATALATTIQAMPQSRPETYQRADFAGAQTMPADLGTYTQPSALTDLGIDLGMGAAAVSGLAGAASANLAKTSSQTSMGAYAAEEQFKAIGPLRVSLPLYNVYLNEADEWSRRLSTGLAEWAMEPHAKIPSDAVAFAHSLAGSSATVGFSALSGLARSLENALNHMQRIEEDGDYDPHVHASLFMNAAEDIRHLLHQFAAGILKDSSPQIETDLAHCMQAPFPASESLIAPLAANTLTDESASSAVILDEKQPLAGIEPAQSATDLVVPDAVPAAPAIVAEPAPEPVVSWASPEILAPAAALTAAAVGVASLAATPVQEPALEPEPEVIAVQEAVQAPAPAPVASTAPAPALASLTQAPVLAVRSRQIAQDEIDDEIDVQDALDPDLFEIFEEEAQEIFPVTASALRQWSARPDNMSARGEVLRGLHTLKGSARLAGAMRLGELAHRMESNVETIPHEGAQSADIEALMAQLDGMQHNFDVLRNPALANQQQTPAPAPTATASTSAAPANTVSTSPAASVTPLRPMAAATGMVAPAALRSAPGQTVRVRAQLLDRLMNQAGEVMITRARLEAELSQLRGSLTDLGGNLEKLRSQLRELDVQAESQMQTRLQQTKETEESFDPLEFDRYTRVQELTRMMAESVNDVATVQRNIQRTIESTEDDLVMQARQTRDLQRDLLRTRMVEFEGISERLYRVVRQAGKDAGKQVKLDILGGTIEMDRGVLDRMTPAFEHLLRNCVAHGIETAEARTAAGKAASGEIVITLHQEGNDVSIEFRDDGAGLNIARIREKAISQGLIGNDAALPDSDAANLIFTPGFSTAATITELSGRGVGMDVVRSEVVALGGRIETATSAGQGTSFKLVLPLTTAVTQVVMLRIGQLAIGVPANLIETVRRATQKELQSAYNSGTYEFAGESLPFFWAGALLQHSAASNEPATKTLPIAVFRSAAQRVVMHIDEVLGNQEVVVKNLGPQLSRLPGLAGMTVMTSGAVALIYNPVALATVYGSQARAMSFDPAQPHALESQSQMGSLQDIADAVPRELSGDAQPVVPLVPANPASISPPAIPMVLVVDDSITVRRVTQRLLQREGYRVTMAADGLQALERLAEELPSVILSDIEMPRMDGFDLLRNVRGDAKLKHLPTIMITSRIAEKHREYAFELGANHYLGKPYNEEELLSLIRRYAREEATI